MFIGTINGHLLSGLSQDITIQSLNIMQKFNKESYGEKIYVNFDQDISAATTLKIFLLPQSGDEQELTAVLETSDLFVGDRLFLANQFVSFTTTDGQFDYVGHYQKRATAIIGSTKISTDYRRFQILGRSQNQRGISC